MSKLEIKYVSPDELRPYAGNARTHSKKQIRQIADSIQRFGFTNPVIVSVDREVIAGHGRLAAAKLRGLTSVPTLQLLELPVRSLKQVSGCRGHGAAFSCLRRR